MLCFSAPLSRSAALSLPLAALSPAPPNNSWDGAGWGGEPRLPFSLKADQEILFMHATKWEGHVRALLA